MPTVTVVDLNEERIAAWNDEDVDNIPFTNRVCQKSLRKLEGKLIFSPMWKGLLMTQIIFISVNTPTKTYGKGKGMAADLKYIIMCQTDC
jgi:UDPglucose 6-dehydrogenase